MDFEKNKVRDEEMEKEPEVVGESNKLILSLLKDTDEDLENDANKDVIQDLKEMEIGSGSTTAINSNTKDTNHPIIKPNDLPETLSKISIEKSTSSNLDALNVCLENKSTPTIVPTNAEGQQNNIVTTTENDQLKKELEANKTLGEQNTSVENRKMYKSSELINLLVSSNNKDFAIDVEMKETKDALKCNETILKEEFENTESEGKLYFYNKDCINFHCNHSSELYSIAPIFCLSYFKVSKTRNKPQYICHNCFDICYKDYKMLCLAFVKEKPILNEHIPKKEDFVEIIDSSDDEEKASADKMFEEPFDKTTVNMIEKELVNTINSVLCDVSVQNQLSWTSSILQTKIKQIKNNQNYIQENLKSLQKKADSMHNSLYSCCKIKIRPAPPIDLGPSSQDQGDAYVPPFGEIHRPPIEMNTIYYAAKNKVIASWVPCKVVEQHVTMPSTAGSQSIKNYKIKFLKTKLPLVKVVATKHMAYFDPPKVRLQIGARVIALFDTTTLTQGKGSIAIPSAFYPGVVAEPLRTQNKFRYLIFFDDGYAQYVSNQNVRLVCESSQNVWDDVHVGSREFIHSYLTQYLINRPMVQTQKGQSMITESNGKWIYAKVVDVDCSLVQMQFQSQHMKTEWIYRGSTRLGPVYREAQKALQATPTPPVPVTRPRRTAPFIRYTQDEEPTRKNSRGSQDEDLSKKTVTQTEVPPEVKTTVRAVAKKSISRPDSSSLVLPQSALAAAPVKLLNNETIFVDDDNRPKGKIIFYTAKKNRPPRTFTPHTCSPLCLIKVSHNLNAYSPLTKPLLSGWERLIYIRTRVKKYITYRGPCGKQLRNMSELHRYLRTTNCSLNVDNFDFNCDINCLAEYVIESCITQKSDLSNGKEKMPIQCVNYYDNTMPPSCVYSTERIPTEGVNLNLDKNFLAGCECEGDCSDKSKCACWQLTLGGYKYSDGSLSLENIGYTYKRLLDSYSAGIYECNSNCKCSSSCINRVVQHPLNIKLQVFKTSNRGWGIRCINDVPKGSFICIYAGHLLTEQKANEGGVDAGDEYFAELDYIESIERVKEGYESDVQSIASEVDSDNDNCEDDEDEDFNPRVNIQKKVVTTRQKSKSNKFNYSTNTDEDDTGNLPERQLINFEPNTMMENNEEGQKFKSVRKMFGKDEDVYVMDAKITGNIGRYFNHSCSPNLFVQNVFVDTHDLRFPWIAFFSNTNIRAGTELTWNYNYEVGVVPGKVLYCECGAPNCRGRLL